MSGRLPALIRPHLSYANAMSTLAVFFVLAGGTALAVALPRNSVGSATVKNGSLRSADLADGKGVRAADVADGSLGGADLADGSLSGAEVADGSLGGADLAAGSLGAAQIGAGAVGSDQLAPSSVTAAGVVDGTIGKADVANEGLLGKNIDESTLVDVPSAEALNEISFRGLLSSLLVESTSPLELGAQLPDGTRKISTRCPAGGVMVSGGPLDVTPSSTLIENFPKDGTWNVRIDPRGRGDLFGVRVLCAI
jgi:hypothetical protein